MRAIRAGALAAAPIVAYVAVTALLSARQLAGLDERLRLAPDPTATTLESFGLLLALAVFAVLGRRLGDPRLALRAGAVAGGLAGLLGGAAQSLAAAPFLARALDRYAVPDGFLAVVLAAYVALATAVGFVVGAAVAWIAARTAPHPRTGPTAPASPSAPSAPSAPAAPSAPEAPPAT